jgi:hypothetical protein
MKTLLYIPLKRLRRLMWSCLWAIPIAFALFTQPGFAAPPGNIDFGAEGDCPADINTDSPINKVVGADFNDAIEVENPPASFNWSFSIAPTSIGSPSCSGGGDTYTCSNTTISLPAAGGPGSTARVVSPYATPVGEYEFEISVSNDDGPALQPCRRRYSLNINETPIDTAFVLDRSGSMTSTTGVTAPASNRWTALQMAVKDATALMQANVPTGSRLGLTWFSTAVTNNFAFPNTLETINSALHTNVVSEVDNTTPGGWTAMGCGLKARIPGVPVPPSCGGAATTAEKLTDTSRSRVVALFTDGEQNKLPCVTPNGEGLIFDNPSGLTNAECRNIPFDQTPDEAIPADLRIVSVSVGQPSAAYNTTLQNLATSHGGHYISTSNGVNVPGAACANGITDTFDCLFVDLLKDNSPLMVAAYTGTLTSEREPEMVGPFEINRNLKQLLIKLSFDRNVDSEALQDWLSWVRITKDGADITPYFQSSIVDTLGNSLILTTTFQRQRDASIGDLETLNSQGSYRLELTKPSNLQGDLAYRVIPYADDFRLTMDWYVDTLTPQVNQPFTPTVQLQWQGEPITNAEVTATVEQPGGELGDLLAKNPTRIKPTDGPDDGSPGYQKYLALLEDEAFVDQLAFNPNQITLVHQGGGRYSAPYNPGNISGAYQIIYTVKATDPDLGSPIQRRAEETKWVRFGPIDMDDSTIDVRTDGRTIIWDWSPITVDGWLIGPGQELSLSVTGEAKLTRLQDNQDGSYTLTLVGDPTAPVTVKVLDQVIYQGPADQFGTRQRRFPWWIWLLVLLLLLLALLIWYWQKQPTEEDSEAS